MGLFDFNPFTGLLDKVSSGTGTPGPQGPKGDKGDKGDQGDPGADGADGKAATITFINIANLNNGKFLSLQQASTFPSNENPFMVPFDTDIIALSFINEKNNIDVDLQVRVNGTIVFTWSLTDVRRAIKTNGLSGITVVAGDLISLSATNVSAIKPKDVIVHFNLAYTSAVEQEITSATL